jgi:hypothetical protein
MIVEQQAAQDYLAGVTAEAGMRAILKRNAAKERKFNKIQANMRLAARSFPNNRGGYTAKREPKPLVPALTPAERFNRLAGEYLSRRCAIGRHRPVAQIPPLRKWHFFFDGIRRHIWARTLQQAQVRIRKAYGVLVNPLKGCRLKAAA